MARPLQRWRCFRTKNDRLRLKQFRPQEVAGQVRCRSSHLIFVWRKEESTTKKRMKSEEINTKKLLEIEKEIVREVAQGD